MKTSDGAEHIGSQDNATVTSIDREDHTPDSQLTIFSDSDNALVTSQATLWDTLSQLKNTEYTLETRLALKETYASIAKNYANFGGYNQAALLLTNALAHVDDPELRHYLARMQASDGGYDFIVTFQSLLKRQPYNLALALEFCFFLETRGLHEAALSVLEDELKKRLIALTPSDGSEASLLNGFLNLVRANAIGDQHYAVNDYQLLLQANFPKEVVGPLSEPSREPVSMIVGPELEEYNKDHGIKKEVLHYANLIAFFTRYYPELMIIIASVIALFMMAILRIRPHTVEIVGDTLATVLMSFVIFEFLRSFRLPEGIRHRAHRKVAQNALFGSFALIALNWLAPKVFGGTGSFLSVIVIKAFSAVLVGALLWRAYLSAAHLQRILSSVNAEIVSALTRRSFRRQLAALVEGTAKWALVLGIGFLIAIISRGTPAFAGFAALQVLLLSTCWRWGYLEARANKQPLRDFLAGFIGIIFATQMFIESIILDSALDVIIVMSFDGVLVLGVAVTYALQIFVMRRILFTSVIGVFVALNFLPALNEIAVITLFSKVWALSDLTAVGRSTEIAVLLAAILLVRKRRHTQTTQTTYHTETYMNTKYQITGGNVGAVGDNAHATNFAQASNEQKPNVDLALLATELSNLRTELASLAKEPSHFTSLGEVAAAEIAAKKGDGPLVLEKLKLAGAWFWETAQKIGIGVATAAAKQALGV